MTDDRPSIAELQRLCRDDGANHDADLVLAVPTLLAVVAAALAWREAMAVDDYMLQDAACEALDAAAAKVRR